jgi:hypothetical protein
VRPHAGRSVPRPSATPLAAEPDIAVTRLLEEIRELGYTGSANLIVRYLNQGRDRGDRGPPPRRLVSWLMTRPAEPPEHDRGRLEDLLASCPHVTVLAEHVRAIAEMLTIRRGADLESWMTAVDASDLPALHAFVRGLRKDLNAVTAGLTLPYSNGPQRGRQHKGQSPEAADVRAGGLQAAATADPAQLTAGTTSYVPEPIFDNPR